MKINALLPLGTIVVLKDGEKKLMITGVIQTNADGDGKEYDYLSVMYPEGYMGEELHYLFNHDDISDIVFRGYEDTERNEFLSRLTSLYAGKVERETAKKGAFKKGFFRRNKH